MTAGLSFGHWLLWVAVEPAPLLAGDEAESCQDGEGTVTFCVKIVALILQAQGPQALRVLIPVVSGHEDPVVVALAADIQRSVASGWHRRDRARGVSHKSSESHPDRVPSGKAREGTAGSQDPLRCLTPDGHERGARAHGAGEEDLQVPAAAVGERKLDLHVLERADEAAARAI